MQSLFSSFKVLSESSISSILEKINYSNVENISKLVSNTKITTIPNIMRDNLHLKNISSVFSGCASLTDISSFSEFDISQVTSFSSLFTGCKSLADISSLSNLDTSQVSSFEALFRLCSALTDLSPLENWNTSKVTNMRDMFSGISSSRMNINNI